MTQSAVRRPPRPAPRTHTTCRHCGFGIPADAPLCPGCSRPAVDDWRAEARRQRRERPPIATPLVDDGYRSLVVAATVARGLLWTSAAAAAVTGAAFAWWTARIDDEIVTLPGDGTPTTIDVSDVATWAIGAFVAVLVVTAAAFVHWAVRAYRNLPALRIEERRYWTIWLVIGWVIPGANLFVPKLVVNDLWRASSPNASLLGGDSWQRRPVASIVNRWWWSFLVTPALVFLGVVTARGGLDDFEQQAAVGVLCVAATASILVAAVAARRLVAVVSVAQARRADLVVDVRDAGNAALEHLLAMESADH